MGVFSMKGPKSFHSNLKQKEMVAPLVRTKLWVVLEWCMENSFVIGMICVISLGLLYMIIHFTQDSSEKDNIIIKESQALVSIPSAMMKPKVII